jgi:hypothetical protein
MDLAACSQERKATVRRLRLFFAHRPFLRKVVLPLSMRHAITVQIAANAAWSIIAATDVAEAFGKLH